MRPDLASCVSRVTSPEGDLKGEATIIQCGWTLGSTPPVRLGLAALRALPRSDLGARRNLFNQCGGPYRRFPMRLNDAKRVGNELLSRGRVAQQMPRFLD